MASNLYEVLGLDRTATSEDIRKAYRKRALKTHPDRLPQGVSETEKQAANEQFRLVNNAYEVLTDPTNRKLYDTHGVWPPPTSPAPASTSSSTSSSPFASSHYQTQSSSSPWPFPFPGLSPFDTDPFFTTRSHPNPHPQTNLPPSPFSGGGWHFTDPFELFNSLFGDTRRPGFSWGDDSDFDDPFFGRGGPGGMGSPFSFGGGPFGFGGPFGGGGPGGMFGGGPPGGGPRDPFGRPLMSMIGPFSHPLLQISSNPSSSNVRSYSSSTTMMGMGGQGGGEGQWVSQSTMTRSINGRSETVTKRRDAQGNEHVTYTSPEGERYTINGVEQPSGSGRGLPSSSSSQQALPQSQSQQAQGLPGAPQPQMQMQSTAFAPPPPQMQGAGAFPPPFAPQQVQPQQVSRSQSRHSTSSSYYDQPDAQRDRPSSTHRSHRSSHDRPHPSSHSSSYPQNYPRDSYDSSRRNRDKIYAPPGDRDRDSGHHVGDSGSRHVHRDDGHGTGRSGGGRSGSGGGGGRHGSVGW